MSSAPLYDTIGIPCSGRFDVFVSGSLSDLKQGRPLVPTSRSEGSERAGPHKGAAMDWKHKLISAAWNQGLRTVDLANVPGASAVTLDELDQFAQRNYPSMTSSPWSGFIDHVRGLVNLGCATFSVGKGAGPWNIAFLVTRVAPDGILDIQEAWAYYNAIEGWLREMEQILPDVKMSESEKNSVQGVASKVLGAVGAADLASIAADIIVRIVESGKYGACVTLHPVVDPGAQWLDTWAASDMVSCPAGHLCNVNVVWNTRTDQLTSSKTTSVENWQKMVPTISLGEFHDALAGIVV